MTPIGDWQHEDRLKNEAAIYLSRTKHLAQAGGNEDWE
jgi:hypothetical protein